MKQPRLEKNRDFYAAVGQNIAKARKSEKQKNQLTQEALAKKASLTRTSIINIEKGRQQILLHTLLAIARALEVPVQSLIPDTTSLETLLHDKPQKGIDWIKSSTSDIKSKEV